MVLKFLLIFMETGVFVIEDELRNLHFRRQDLSDLELLYELLEVRRFIIWILRSDGCHPSKRDFICVSEAGLHDDEPFR